MEDWDRLADHVRAGRVRRGFPNRRAFAAHLRDIGHPVTERTLGSLERGERVSMDTVVAVEIGLGWATGSGRAVLQGGEPKHTTTAADAEPVAEVPPYIDLDRAEDWEAEIWQKLVKLSPEDKGLMIQFMKGIRESRAAGAGAERNGVRRQAG